MVLQHFFLTRLKLKRAQTLLLLPLILYPPPPLSYTPFSFFSATHPPSLPKLHHHLSSLKPFLDQTLLLYSKIRDFEVEEELAIDGDFLENLRKKANQFSSEGDAMDFLDESGLRPTGGLVCSGIWALRDEWKLALLVFKWGEKWGCNSSRAWDLMVWVLGNQRRFSIAWRLVCDMVRSSRDPRRAMLFMIESYAAANIPGKAIRTFQAMEKFKITQDSKAFYTLLCALCQHGNIEEAEEFMLINKNLFPLGSESFNIILDGWCNISLDIVEAKRVWREMSNYCITPDATSYTHMISCFSKVGNLFDSLRLYDEMKKRGWVPGLSVYNSLIYVLTRENCMKQALDILEKIKEASLKPDSSTYNSIILPLCETHKLEEARNLLANMLQEGLNPTSETYHAFIERESVETTLDLLKQMRAAGSGPNGHTFFLILNKYQNLEQPDNALRMWTEMKKYDVVPNSTHYSVLVKGLVACGWLVKAREFYGEMRFKGFLDDPRLKNLLKETVSNDTDHEEGQERDRKVWVPRRKGSAMRRRKDWKAVKKGVTNT